VGTGSKPNNVGNLRNVRCEASRHFTNDKKETKIEELETNTKTKNIRGSYKGIKDFKKGYQPRTNVVKDKKGDLVTYLHGILAKWRNHFSQLLNVRGLKMLGREKYTQ